MKIKHELLSPSIISNIYNDANLQFDIIGEVFDYGPQTTEIIINFNKDLEEQTLDKETFIIIHEGKKRKIEKIRFINPKTLILELEHGQGKNEAAILELDDKSFHNVKKNITYILKQNKDIQLKDKTTIKKDKTTYTQRTLKIKGVDKFNCGEKYGLKYRDYKPEKDEKKHPLIIWLHGAGEGGKSNVTQILANKGGVAFIDEKTKKIFDNPYVLAPQSPTFWMKSFKVKDRELIGEKDYTPDLVNLIKDYIAENDEIDKNRIYIGGCSMGGYQTFKILTYAPNLFAASFISCPAYQPSEKELEKIKTIPIWLVHASEDTTVPVEYSRKIYNFLKNNNSDTVYTEYKDVILDGNKYDAHASYFYTLNNKPKDINGIHIFQWLASKKLKN